MSVALALGDLAVVPGSFFGLAFCLPIDSLCLSSRLLWLLWQDSRAMYPLFADCTKKGVSLAAFARNACFSRCSWQDLRPMHPFRGAIGRFRIHSARILPGKPPFLRRGPWNHAWGEDPANARRCAGLSAPAGSRSRKVPDMVAEDCWSERLNLAIALLLHSKTRRAPWALSW